jgi:amphi-Trp domain-containing protein
MVVAPTTRRPRAATVARTLSHSSRPDKAAVVIDAPRTEPAMSDVKVEHKVVMTRAEVAQWIADVGKALSGDGTVSIRLADSTVELKVPDHVRCEAEVEVDGDEVELELELRWSTARTGAKGVHPKGAAEA